MTVAERTETATNEPVRPNILLVVADDLGWADVGYHGSELLTPNLDRLVRNGVELDQHYVAPVCSPTRAGLLSGRYCSRFGCTTPTNDLVYPFGTLTLASALASVGYDTCITGKWHLGSKAEWGPRQFGFRHTHGSFAGGVGPWNHLYKDGPFTRTWHRNDELVEEEGHVTDLIGREAVRFIEMQRDCPFFIYVPFTAVHTPIDEPPEWLDMNRHIPERRRQFAGSTSHMDHVVGQLVEALDRTGQRENTLLIFFSDNGGARRGDNASYPGVHPPNEVLGLNGPLRGWKAQVYDGGVRTPAFVQWPGMLGPRKLAAPLHVTDWMPTLCGLAGCRPEADPRWDGADIWPVLQGADAAPAERTLYTAGPHWRSGAVREGDWKLVVHRAEADSSGWCAELFDLGADPGESQDLALDEADRAEHLFARLEAEMSQDGEPVPGV